MKSILKYLSLIIGGFVMDSHEPSITATKPFRLSVVLSLIFHSIIFVFFLASSLPQTEIPQRTEPLVMQVHLIETTQTGGEFAQSVAKKSVAKHPPVHTVAVSRKTGNRISAESLQTEIRSVAYEKTFGNFAEKNHISLDSSYRSYVDNCRDKLVRIGNREDEIGVAGSVMLHLTIKKNGEVAERYVDEFSSPEIEHSALQTIARSSPFAPFPKEMKQEAIKIAIPVYFVTSE